MFIREEMRDATVRTSWGIAHGFAVAYLCFPFSDDEGAECWAIGA